MSLLRAGASLLAVMVVEGLCAISEPNDLLVGDRVNRWQAIDVG